MDMAQCQMRSGSRCDSDGNRLKKENLNAVQADQLTEVRLVARCPFHKKTASGLTSSSKSLEASLPLNRLKSDLLSKLLILLTLLQYSGGLPNATDILPKNGGINFVQIILPRKHYAREERSMQFHVS